MALHKFLIEHAIWPAMEKRKGNKIREIQRALEKSQYEDVAALQRERLTELLLHCKAHVPAYESVLPDEDTIRQDPYAALRCVQPLAKRTFQTEAEAHLADNVPQSVRIANCTGGSTGEPVRFFMTRAQVESYEAARWRGLGWYGITQGSRSVMLWGSPIELSQQAQLKNRIKESLLKNRQILSAYHLSEQELAKQVDGSVFPGMQGGALQHVVAAKAIAAEEACTEEYRKYIFDVVKNCKAMCDEFVRLGYDVVTGGTDNHLFLLDLTDTGLTGKAVQDELDRHGITLNKNCVPNEKRSPVQTSGVRIGTAAETTKGKTAEDFVEIAREIDRIISAM